MEHEEVKAQLSLLIDGELDGEREQAVRTHLDGCSACRAEYEELRATVAQLSGLARVTPPPAFSRSVQTRIRKRSRGRFFRGEGLLARIPFEWISFVIIVLMLAMYYTMMASVSTVGSAAKSTRPQRSAPAKGAAPRGPAPVDGR